MKKITLFRKKYEVWGFDPQKCLEQGSFSGGQMYEYEFRSLYNLIEREIKNSRYDINRLTKRLADWVAPK